eukprot:tig00000204_g17780.t1
MNGITDLGAQAFVEALRRHPRLDHLDLTASKSFAGMQQCANRVGLDVRFLLDQALQAKRRARESQRHRVRNPVSVRSIFWYL